MGLGLIFGGIFANISDLPIAYTQSMGTGIVFNEEEANRGVAFSCIFLACQQFLMMNMGMFQIVGLDFKDKAKIEKKMEEVEDVGEGTAKDLEKGEVAIESEFNIVPLVRENDNNNDSDAVSEPSYRSFDTRRRRRSSVDSGLSFSRIRSSLESTYTTRGSRKHKVHNIQSLIDEYSEAYRINEGNLNLRRTLSKTQEIGLNLDCDEEELEHAAKKAKHEKWNNFIKKYKLQWLEYMLINLIRPASISLLSSIIVSMIPWLRALFVKTNITSIHDAPDKLPPLNFMMDFTS